MALPPGDLAALEVLDHDTLTTALAKRYAHGSIYVRENGERNNGLSVLKKRD